MTDDLDIHDDDPVFERLSPQERLFVEAYGNPESETFGNGTKSAAAAKFAQPHNAAWKLKKRPHIKAALEAMYEQYAGDVGRVMVDLEHARRKSAEKGDWATVRAAAKLPFASWVCCTSELSSALKPKSASRP